MRQYEDTYEGLLDMSLPLFYQLNYHENKRH